MKKQIYTLMMAVLAWLNVRSQHTVTFESFTLAPNSFYSDTTSKPFEDAATKFRHEQLKFSNAWYWIGGFSYTNKYDSSTAGFTNLYGVKPYWGYNMSSKYCVAQNYARLVLKSPYNQLDGFYITNTTYAFKSMKYGDAFAKKFGGPSGNDPDFFKLTVRGYLNGNLKTDSVEFYLADYRFSNNAQDYIISTWQWVNTTSLGQVDSLEFELFSSDNGPYGMNTPAYFGLDNVTVSNPTGIKEHNENINVDVYPNPARDVLFIQTSKKISYQLTDVNGKKILEGTSSSVTVIHTSSINEGIYILKIFDGFNFSISRKVIIVK
jgi:hypothetical protein